MGKWSHAGAKKTFEARRQLKTPALLTGAALMRDMRARRGSSRRAAGAAWLALWTAWTVASGGWAKTDQWVGDGRTYLSRPFAVTGGRHHGGFLLPVAAAADATTPGDTSGSAASIPSSSVPVVPREDPKAGSGAAPTMGASASHTGAQQTEGPNKGPPAATGESPSADQTPAPPPLDDHATTQASPATADPAPSQTPTIADPIADLAASCAIEHSFGHDVLRQSNVTLASLTGSGGGRERVVCTTDAEKGAAAVAAAEDARLRREKEARKAKEREAKEKAKIPSLKDFKSDIAAKVSAAKAAKEEPKEHTNVVPKDVPKDVPAVEPNGTAPAVDLPPSAVDGANAAEGDATSEETPVGGTHGTDRINGHVNVTGTDKEKVPSGPESVVHGSKGTGEETRERADAPDAEAQSGERARDENSKTQSSVRAEGEKDSRVHHQSPTDPNNHEPERKEAKDDAETVDAETVDEQGGSTEEDRKDENAGVGKETAAPEPVDTTEPRTQTETETEAKAAAEAEAVAEEDPWIAPASSADGEVFVRQYNYASYANGARVVSSNPEAKSSGAALKEDMDSYYLTPCAAKNGKWLTVELSEEAAVTAVTLANYEFHSSGVREFEVWASAGTMDREEDWRRLGRCRASQVRDVQTFVLPRGHWSKYVRVRMISHYGRHHFCTLSLLRVHGKDAKQTLEEEMEAINREVAEVEEILNAGDDYEPAEVTDDGASAEPDLTAEPDPAGGSEPETAAVRDPEDPKAEHGSEHRGPPPEAALEKNGVDDAEAAPADTTASEKEPEGAGEPEAVDAKGDAPGLEPASTDSDDKKVPDDKKEGFFKSWFGKEKAEGEKEKEKEAPPEPNAAEPERPATKETDRAAPSEVSELKEDPNTKQPEVTPEATPEATHAAPEQPTEEVDEVDADAEAAETPPPAASVEHALEHASTIEEADASSIQPPPVVKDDKDKPVPAVPKPSSSEPRSGAPENVFSLMAKKIKSLELNQSMFDRYIESLSASYGGRFEDIAQEVNELEELVANQTTALVEVDKAIERTARGAKSELATALAESKRETARVQHERLTELRDHLVRVERRWETYLGLTMFAVATVLGIAAAGAGAQAALVLWREDGAPSARQRMAAQVTAAACLAAGVLSLMCYFAAAWLVFGRVATSVWAAGYQAAREAARYVRG